MFLFILTSYTSYFIIIISDKIIDEATRIIYEIYGDNVAAERTFRDWFAKFKNKYFKMSNRPHSG